MKVKTKKCSNCQKEKPLHLFYKEKAGLYGVRADCKQCKEDNRRVKRGLTERVGTPPRSTKTKSNKEHKQYCREWYKKNREKKVKQQNEYQRKRIARDPLYKLTKRMRTLVGNYIRKKGFSKKSKTEDVIGCSFEALWAWLEASCKARYQCSIVELGDYHIDHIVPVCSASTEEEVIKLNHWFNLQVLTPEDNLNKGGNL